MIVGPLRGSLRGLEGQVDTSVTSYDDMVDQGVVNHVYSSSLARSDAPTIKSSMLYRSTESFGSDEISDEGYSASGEGTLGNDIDSERRTRRPSRTRHGSLIGNGKPKFNGKTVTVRSAYV